MQLFNRARYAWAGPPASGLVLPRGNSAVAAANVGREDLFGLLRAEDVHLGPGLEA
jgi:hypothetical protein